jgi:hypothetical protein
MDYDTSTNVYVELSGSINGTVGTLTTPTVVARGSCNVVLRGITGLGLVADSLQLLGRPDPSPGVSGDSGGDRWATVHLEGCVLEVDDPRDLIHGDSDGPYYLTWKNCVRRVTDFQGGEYAWGQPIEDGFVVSSGFSIIDTM